jgi:Flp pilus assembly protein TadG
MFTMLLRRRHTRPTRSRSTRHASSGQAIVELAVIGLVLLSTSLAAMEIGRAYYASIAITHAARDGARVAMNPAFTNADVVSAAEAAADPIDPTTVVVTRSITVGDFATVTVEYEFEPVLSIVAEVWGGGALVFSETATSRVGWE